MFIVKYDRDGTALWARRLGSSDDYDNGLGVTVDDAGNSYIAGKLGASVFLAEYDGVGNRRWLKQADSAGIDVEGSAVALDKATNCYVAGFFRGSLAFGTTNLVSSGPGDLSDLEAFVAKFDNTGTLQWARTGGGTRRDFAYGLAVDDQGDSYVAGYFNSPVAVFGNISLRNTSGDAYIFLTKYDTSGNALWARSAGHNGGAWGNAVGLDAAGNCYVTGQFLETCTFETTNLVSAGSFDIFLAKYSAAGQFLWARQAGGDGYDAGRGLAIDALGNVYVTGRFEGTAAFSGTNVVSSNGPEVFLASYDQEGNLMWATQRNGQGYADEGYGVTLDGLGDIYVTGSLATTNQVWTNIVTSSYFVPFVAKYEGAPCPPRIIRQTGSHVRLEGLRDTLKVVVLANPPPSLQWCFDGAPIESATNDTYTIPSVSPADAGGYSVFASNRLGTATGPTTVLGVNNVEPSAIFAGLLLTAPSGTRVQIQAAGLLGHPTLWQPLADLTVQASPHVFIDLDSTNASQRFYRTTQQNRIESLLLSGWNYTAPAGSQQRIEYVDAQVGYTNWQFLTNVTLPSSPYLFIDESVTNLVRRYYRSTPLP